MPVDNPSIMNHVSIGVADPEKAWAFYDAVLATIGAVRVVDEPTAVAYGKVFPEFWVHVPFDSGSAEKANGSHFSFNAASIDQVQAFYEAAIANGATDDGPPGPRPEYGDPYYGCFVRDPDGHKIEATYWDVNLA